MKYVLLTFLLCVMLIVNAQENNEFPQYPSPLRIPVYLSATFGELRSNAFHAGVDIKTGGVEGKEVFAVADGYVSRISVSPYGYGKAIYVTHNDGFMSVYAHLQCFNDEIGEYVREKQYETQSFRQNIILKENEIVIKKVIILVVAVIAAVPEVLIFIMSCVIQRQRNLSIHFFLVLK